MANFTHMLFHFLRYLSNPSFGFSVYLSTPGFLGSSLVYWLGVRRKPSGSLAVFHLAPFVDEPARLARSNRHLPGTR